MKKKSNDVTPLYNRMLRELAKCYRTDEGEQIRDKDAALKFYARQAQNFEPERKLIQIRLRAERMAKKLIREMPPETLKKLMETK